MKAVRITVIGGGYVGLVSGACLAAIGHDVTIIERDPTRRTAIDQAQAPFFEPGLAELLMAHRLKTAAEISPETVGTAHVTLVCVGTPSGGDAPDLSALESAVLAVAQACCDRDGDHVIAVKSTVPPGTTRRVLNDARSGLPDADKARVHGVMNPEFLRQGVAVNDFQNPDRIVIGAETDRAREIMAQVYAPYDCPILTTSLETAEMAKCGANAALATLISFSNEMAALCERTPGADVADVLEAITLDRRWAVDGQPAGITRYLVAGGGFGGSCLPKDVDALRHFADGLGASTPVLDGTAAVNKARPGAVVDAIARAAGGLSGKRVAMLGLAFKPDTDDTRDSPAIALYHRIKTAGARVTAWDPMVSDDAAARIDFGMQRVPSVELAVKGADMVVIGTAWHHLFEIDWAKLAGLASDPLLFDTRGAFGRGTPPRGWRYHTIGHHPDTEAT